MFAALAAAIAVVVMAVAAVVVVVDRRPSTTVALSQVPPRHVPANFAPTQAAPVGGVPVPPSPEFLYSHLVLRDLAPLSSDSNAFNAACAAQDRAGCRAASVALEQDAKQFLTDLSATVAPTPFATADALLHRALGDYASGAAQLVKGIDGSSAGDVTAGAGQMTAGDQLMAQAAAALEPPAGQTPVPASASPAA